MQARDRLLSMRVRILRIFIK